MAWLSLLLFLPWFLLLGSLYWLFPRQPRTARRRLFDGTTLVLAFALSIVSMLWGYRIGVVQPGAGLLMQQLPNAKAVLHPRGAPHMIDPTRLIAGATAVYGADEIPRSYGRIEAIPESRVVVAEDGHRIDLAGRELVLLHTPGHALHHYCVWDARSRSWFTGDTFGISYRELDSAQGAFIFPTSSPVQFDPEAMKASIQRMLGYCPQAMYLTHYGRVEQVEKLAGDLFEQIDAMAAIGRQCDGRPDRHRCLLAALQALYLERAQLHGCALDDAAVTTVRAMDIELNAQGLAGWLDRISR